VSLNYNHGVRNWWVNADYNDFGDDFRSDVGFRPRVGFRSLRTSGARVWWGEEGDFFHRSAWGGAAFRTERQTGDLLDEGFQSWFNFQGPKEMFASVDASSSTRKFSGVEFDLWDVGLGFNIQASANFSLALNARGGDWIDFTHVRPAERTVITPSLLYKIGRHLSIRYAHIFSALDVEGGRLFRINAPELRVIHQFNTRAFVRLIMQYTRIDRDQALFTDAVDETSESLLSQFLFTYKVNPQTALFVGYTDNQFGTEAFDLVRTDRTFFVKLGYAWVP